jgi:hypothetical protein
MWAEGTAALGYGHSVVLSQAKEYLSSLNYSVLATVWVGGLRGDNGDQQSQPQDKGKLSPFVITFAPLWVILWSVKDR